MLKSLMITLCLQYR